MKTITKRELAQIIADLLGHVGERCKFKGNRLVPTNHPVNALIAKARKAVASVEVEVARRAR